MRPSSAKHTRTNRTYRRAARDSRRAVSPRAGRLVSAPSLDGRPRISRFVDTKQCRARKRQIDRRGRWGQGSKVCSKGQHPATGPVGEVAGGGDEASGRRRRLPDRHDLITLPDLPPLTVIDEDEPPGTPVVAHRGAVRVVGHHRFTIQRAYRDQFASRHGHRPSQMNPGFQLLHVGIHRRLAQKLAQTRRRQDGQNAQYTQHDRQFDQGHPRTTRTAEPAANRLHIHEYSPPLGCRRLPRGL